MRVALFYHSLISDWNHGNAHFLRGIASELIVRGHQITVWEPRDAWSVQNLIAAQGEEPIREFHARYGELRSVRYDESRIDLGRALDGQDLVIVHEWNSHELVRRIGAYRSASDFTLLFHDTHHRSVTDPAAMAAYDLSQYDGVLAFGEAVRQVYLRNGWVQRVWTWHEAADTRVFHPVPGSLREGDLVWVGNWGDGERTSELHEFLLDPVRDLGLRARMYGVRYPADALSALSQAGIAYGGWIANFRVPEAFAKFRATVHVPRRPYAVALRGIPTIRPFEAMACGIPLICAPWEDAEHLFTPGRDYLVAANGNQMREHLRDVLNDETLASDLTGHARRTILARHTCAHRVDELLTIVGELRGRIPSPEAHTALAATEP